MAKGEYMCFVDDDDRVTHNYVEAIMGDLLQHPNKDVYTFKVSYSDGSEHHQSPVDYSLHYTQDKNLKTKFERIPNHLMVFKTALARSVQFRDINKGEDAYWAKEIKPLLKTEHKIEKHLYFYNWSFETSLTQGRNSK